MISVLSASTILFVAIAPIFKTPMKMITILILTSLNIFMLSWYWTASSWMPMIFFLMFVGGVVMLFVMVASTLPNEKSNKSFLILMNLGILMMCMNMFMNYNASEYMNLKWNFQSFHSIEMLCLIIISYFFMFLYILSSKVCNIRSETCLLNSIL